jgi:uncharacterized repeat protein (TIGR01451 family)
MKTTTGNQTANSLLPSYSVPRSRRFKPVQVAALLVAVIFLLFGTAQSRAQGVPPGCSGSAIGISLFTSAPDVHIGDTITYSVSVFNGIAGNPTSCDASNIVAWITTPDLVVHPIVLRRTYLTHAQSDFYTNIVSYVARAQDVRPDGTLRATAEDTATIFQNDTPSTGGANQGVNTEVSLPCIQLLVQCVPSVGENGAIVFNGTVTNCGNNTLVGVTVTNYVNGGAFPVFFPTNLLRGQSVTFTGSYIPDDPCQPSTATLVATGRDQFTANPRTVVSTNLTTCSAVITRGIQVRKTCPVGPTAPGQLITFSGSVSNTGNITVTNVVVMNNQPAPNTLVFSRASLAPGEVATFTASYVAPTNCSVTDTLTATATGACGVLVSSTATATCAISTAPAITVTEVCPITPGVSGGTSTYGGVVRNSGNITLNNVVVFSDRPTPNTVVLTVPSLAPGASANYSATFNVPLNVCSVTTSVRATGNDSCTGTAVTNTATATCPITTAPAIAVTLACPATQSTNGGLITYTGTVRNSGNVTLNNIVVMNPQSSPATVFTTASLAPGAVANFTASFTAPATGCSVSSTVVATGSDNCTSASVTNTASATCTLATNPRLIVTQLCSVSPVSPGGVLTYSGTVSNAGNVTVTNIVVTNDRTGATPVFTALTLIPGASSNFTGSYTVPANADCSITSTLTARGNDLCSGGVVTNAASATCSITGTPLINVTLNCPANSVVTGNSITFSGTVNNPGNVTLVNVTVVNNQASPSTVFSVATLAPGASANFTATFASPANACSVSSTVTARGSNTCAGVVATATASATCTLLTAPALVVRQNCPVTPVSAGGVLAYSGSVSNAGNLTLTNVIVINSQTGTNVIYTAVALLPGAVSNFTGSFTVPVGTLCTISSTATATGREICAGNTLTNSATNTCTLATAPAIAVTLNCPVSPTAPGGLVTYTGSVQNSGNVTLNNVTVVNSQASPSTVLTVASLAPGASASFTASFTVALDACSVSSSVVARGVDACSANAVTNSASATCLLVTTPRLTVTQTCPTLSGGVLVYSGTVSNAGNITLTNVLVRNDRSGGTVVFAVATLAPGARASFNGSYSALVDACSLTSTVTATAADKCTGSSVLATATANCSLPTNPRIVVTQTCPPEQVAPGSVLVYSGTVSNAGNSTLTNVVVRNNRTGPTNVFTIAVLAPRATASFTGSYLVLTDCCTDTSTLTASGRDCNNTLAQDTATRTCMLLTAPAITVTKVCPNVSNPLVPGDLMTYSGVVSNSGNITLTNVTIVSTAPTNGVRIFGPITLAAGEAAHYTASFIIPADFCGTETVTARGVNICTLLPVTSSATTTCPVTTTPGITVIKNCPAQPTVRGSLFVFSGTVINSGNVTLTNVFVVNDSPTNNTPVIGPITLAPGARQDFTGSYLTALHCTDCCQITDTLTAVGQDRCAGTIVTDTATQVCPVLTAPGLSVAIACPATPVAVGGFYEFAGLVTNTSTEVLTDVYVVSNLPVPDTILDGPFELAPGESQFFVGGHTVTAGSSALIVRVSARDVCRGNTVNAAANCSGPITTPNQPRAITVVISGNGTVSGVANGQVLTIGQNYTATATPAAGSTFVSWSGGVSATTPAVTFTMRSNLVLIANFTFSGTNGSNVFIPVAGVFNGLFYDTNDVQSASSGSFRLTMRLDGSYKATVRNSGRSYGVKGQFDLNGQAANAIPRTGRTPLTVNWQGNVSDADYLSGTVSDGTAIAHLGGGRDVFTIASPAPQAGRYTLILPGMEGATTSPAGHGFGTVVVDADGDVHLKGRLADGTVLAQNTALSKNGEWPVGISLYGGGGLLIGWLQFGDDGTNDLSGTLRWMKPVRPTSRLYKAGFNVSSDVMGSHYVVPIGTAKMLNITDGVVILNGGNLPDSSNPVTFGASSQLVNNGTNTLKLTFAPASGRFSGSFKEAGTTRIFAIKGAVLQRQNNGSGYAPGTNQSGGVIFQAAP